MSAPIKPLIIHHIEGRRSERVAWLCEELGLPYELKFIVGDIYASLLSMTDVHPMRMAPILEDGNVRLIESGAILEYIILRHGGGRLRPSKDAPEIADYLQWLHFAEGSGMPRAVVEFVVKKFGLDRVPPGEKEFYVGKCRRVLDFAEGTLAGRPYFAGDEFTAADIMMHFPLRMLPQAMQDTFKIGAVFRDDRNGLAEHPNVSAFLDRMAARPAFQRAMARAMPNGPPPT